MQFIPPFDQVGITPPGPWTNAAPQAGVQGSIVNADVFPAVQNELLAIIAADPDLTASSTDLGQAQKSIASQIAGAIGSITATQIFNITGGTGFSVVQSYGSYQPQTPSSHTLDYSFTAPAKGTVLAFSNIASTPQSGLANAVNISVNGTLVASAGDSVSASITDVASYQVKGGDVVDVQSVVSNSQPLTYNTSQRLSLLFFPS